MAGLTVDGQTRFPDEDADPDQEIGEEVEIGGRAAPDAPHRAGQRKSARPGDRDAIAEEGLSEMEARAGIEPACKDLQSSA